MLHPSRWKQRRSAGRKKYIVRGVFVLEAYLNLWHPHAKAETQQFARFALRSPAAAAVHHEFSRGFRLQKVNLAAVTGLRCTRSPTTLSAN